MLEDSLRETFKGRADALPMVDDAAARAIRRARRVRVRQTVVRGLAAVLVLAGMVGGTLQLRHWWEEPAATGGVLSPILPPSEPIHDRPPAPAPERWDGGALGLEFRVVNRVWSAGGERVLLRGTSLVDRAYQTPHGMVYGSDQEVRLRRSDGAVVDVLPDSGPWLVSPDGQRVAAVSNGVLRVVRLATAGLASETAGARVAEGSRPVAFWGDMVVIAAPDGEGFDLWDPAASYEPAWHRDIAEVYGPVGRDLLVAVGVPDGYCLTRVLAGATRLDVSDANGQCEQPLPITNDGFGWLAPGGGWLALPDGDRVRLVEVTLGDDPTEVSCPRQEWKTPTWWDSSTLLTADRNGAISCDVRGGLNRVDLPDRVGKLWEFVPAFGAGW